MSSRIIDLWANSTVYHSQDTKKRIDKSYDLAFHIRVVKNEKCIKRKKMIKKTLGGSMIGLFPLIGFDVKKIKGGLSTWIILIHLLVMGVWNFLFQWFWRGVYYNPSVYIHLDNFGGDNCFDRIYFVFELGSYLAILLVYFIQAWI